MLPIRLAISLSILKLAGSDEKGHSYYTVSDKLAVVWRDIISLID